MGRHRALRALRLEETQTIPSIEVLEHPGIVQKISHIDPFESPLEAYKKALPILDIDWVVDIPQRSVRIPKGQSTIVGDDGIRITEWGSTGSIWEEDYGFSGPEDVLAYRPLEDTRGRVRVVGSEYRRSRIGAPRIVRGQVGDAALISGLYYTTLFQYCIMSFGWENFLTAAALNPADFRIILDQFAEISIENVTEWVRDDCPVFFFHDDLAISRGLVFSPEWYRREIFPRYERILEPAQAAGKIIIFVSDGKYIELIPDLVALGIHGLMVDSSNDLSRILFDYGDRCSVIGNIDTRIITSGTYQDIENEVKRCVDLGKRYPGYFFKASGDLPHNIPIENIESYFKLKRDFGQRH